MEMRITCFQGSIILSWSLVFSFLLVPIWCKDRGITIPSTPSLTNLFPNISFDQGFYKLFGEENIQVLNNGSGVSIMMNKHSGSGFISKEEYQHGFFSTNMKLPSGYTAGVVVAFYMSNSGVFPHNHDEIDFELLGHESGKVWVLQTNLYGNGSVSTGREEKYRLWFDPTEEFHSYTIIWNSHHIVYLVDDIPVREMIYNEKSSRVYPSKPMSVYATIWDGSDWATHGGKKPVDYEYAPFVASFSKMEMAGCQRGGKNDGSPCPADDQELIGLSVQQKAALYWSRKNFLTYSYCTDRNRYKTLPLECT